MHSLAGSSPSRTFLGFTAASSGSVPPQQGAAKPISPPPPLPEKHKTSSYALHSADVPMKTYLILALRRCPVPIHSATLAPLGRICTTLPFHFFLHVIHPSLMQIIKSSIALGCNKSAFTISRNSTTSEVILSSSCNFSSVPRSGNGRR